MKKFGRGYTARKPQSQDPDPSLSDRSITLTADRLECLFLHQMTLIEHIP